MQAIHPHKPDAARHRSAIDALARETHADPSRVRELYERELAELGAHAKVVGYLPVLARRNVKATLRHGRRDGGGPIP